MDGFVHRGRAGAVHRPSLDSAGGSRAHRHTDGFVPRVQNPHSADQPLQFAETTDTWDDENTLTIESPENSTPLPDTTPRRARKEQPHFWQIFKKRRIRKGKPEPSRRKKIIKRVLFVLLIIAVLIGGYLGWTFLKATSKVFDGNVLGFFDSTKLKGEDEGRVNILLAGTSEDDEGHGGADLTDSIMIASIDTKNNTAFTVSIPRDLWVKYGEKCSSGYEGKINVAYQCGNDVKFREAGYFDGGMGLLQKIITTNFGIPIHYYGKISYTAFKDAVDAVDGIDITIKSDDPRGILDRNFDWMCRYQCYKVKYPNGPAHLDGEHALLLARARGANGNTYGTGNDFGRTERQRQMLVALKNKALSSGVISNPAKIGDLMEAAGNNITTSFKSNEVRRLYDLSKLIKDEKITSVDLIDPENPLVTTGNQNGQSIVLPTAGLNNFSKIKAYFKRLTSNDPIIREGATVVVLNASGVIGQAQKQSDELAEKGVTVVAVGNAAARDTTIVIDRTKGAKHGTKSLLEQRFSTTATTTASAAPEAAEYEAADFVVIIGKNGSTAANR